MRDFFQRFSQHPRFDWLLATAAPIPILVLFRLLPNTLFGADFMGVALDRRFSILVTTALLASLIWIVRKTRTPALIGFAIIAILAGVLSLFPGIATWSSFVLDLAYLGWSLHCFWQLRAGLSSWWMRALVLALMLVRLFDLWLVFEMRASFPPARLYRPNAAIVSGEEPVSIEVHPSLSIYGLLRRGDAVKPCALLVHGRHDNVRRMDEWAAYFAERNWSHLRIDLPAHGHSDGQVVTYIDREKEAVLAAYDRLKAQCDDRQILLVAHSMGGGAVLAAAHDRPDLQHAILLSPASDYRAHILGRLGPFGAEGSPFVGLMRHISAAFGVRAPFDADRDVILHPPNLHGLLLQAGKDRLISPAVTRALAARIPGLDYHLVEGVSHGDLSALALQDQKARISGLMTRMEVDVCAH